MTTRVAVSGPCLPGPMLSSVGRAESSRPDAAGESVGPRRLGPTYKSGDRNSAPEPNPGDESEFIARLRVGDGEAHEVLFRAHSGAMLAVARRYLGDTDDAADAVQDAFVSALRAIGTFEGTARPGTWLH